jgi:hypothetical protein
MVKALEIKLVYLNQNYGLFLKFELELIFYLQLFLLNLSIDRYPSSLLIVFPLANNIHR